MSTWYTSTGDSGNSTGDSQTEYIYPSFNRTVHRASSPSSHSSLSELLSRYHFSAGCACLVPAPFSFRGVQDRCLDGWLPKLLRCLDFLGFCCGVWSFSGFRFGALVLSGVLHPSAHFFGGLFFLSIGSFSRLPSFFSSARVERSIGFFEAFMRYDVMIMSVLLSTNSGPRELK